MLTPLISYKTHRCRSSRMQSARVQLMPRGRASPAALASFCIIAAGLLPMSCPWLRSGLARMAVAAPASTTGSIVNQRSLVSGGTYISDPHGSRACCRQRRERPKQQQMKLYWRAPGRCRLRMEGWGCNRRRPTKRLLKRNTRVPRKDASRRCMRSSPWTAQR